MENVPMMSITQLVNEIRNAWIEVEKYGILNPRCGKAKKEMHVFIEELYTRRSVLIR